MPPVETYYGGSAEEQNDLLTLRLDYYKTLRALERQAARFGEGGVPAHIATGIADAKANIRAIDEALRSPIEAATAERLGATGQFNVLAMRIDLVSQQIRLSQEQADEWREHLRGGLEDLAEHQRGFQRTTRMIFTAIGIILALLSLALMGLVAALWSLR